MRTIFALVVVLAIASLVLIPSDAKGGPAPGYYGQYGDAGGFMNILPSGQDGSLNGTEAILAQLGTYPPHTQDQLSMYGNLVYNTEGLDEERLSDFFKDASFGVRADDIDRVYSPTANATIIRDKSFGVPHIFGQTRYATMFAQGYATAEDRLFLMDVLRHLGRARLSEFLGGSEANQHLDLDQLAVAPYKEEDLTRQIEEGIAAAGAEGQATYEDLLAYVDGVNQYINEAVLDPGKLPAEYPALQQLPSAWIPEDTVAIASLVGGIFGKGGGGELTNYCGLQAMTAELGDAGLARDIFNDLHFANDPEAPSTAAKTFPYMLNLGTPNPAATPSIDCASLQPIDDGTISVDEAVAAITGELDRVLTADAPWGPIMLDFNDTMSNALLVTGKKTATGHPIAVFGPQTGYFMPQLLVEKDVHGPGIDARGAAFAGTDIYVQLGRGRDFAWSATSAGGDNIDQFVLKLCEPGGGAPTVNSTGYLHDGVCAPIEAFTHTQMAKPSAGGVPDGPEDLLLAWEVERSEHYGPLIARGTLTDGTPIAVASLRSTYQNELGSAMGFSRINNPNFMTNGFDSFRQAMGQNVHYTFNWFYIDTKDIGYQHSCLCPQRAAGVDPYLPTWGTGEWDWTGYIGFADQPWDKNPTRGYLTSWNNKQAPKFTSNDRNFYYGPAYRSELLDVRIQQEFATGKVDRADVVTAMELAGTTDLRGQEVLPVVLQVMGQPPAGIDARAIDMRNRLAAWVAAGSHRRDLNGNGVYDDPQSPMIIDAWWPMLSHAVFDNASGHAIDNLRLTLDDGNRLGHLGSAFQDGTYGHVIKDLRRLLGQNVSGKFTQKYCGGGNLAACRGALWVSLVQTAIDLEAQFGSPSVADWQRAVADEDVRHQAVGVTGVPAIHWINRPTFQQVVQINGTPPVDDSDSLPPPILPTLPPLSFP